MTILRWAAIAGSMCITGCASIVSDNDSTTYVSTTPESARCELHGQDFTRVLVTPGSIHLPASAAPITIACKADGFTNTTQPLDTELDGWILGNIIFGGIIGVAIDAGRGAGQKFPPQIHVSLQPETFTNPTERDAWFDRKKTTTAEKWDKALEKARRTCNRDRDSHFGSACAERLKEAEAERDAELETIEKERILAKVTG